MVIGYYNLWRDILIKSLNIVAKVRNCFFFNILEYKITNIESNRWKMMFWEKKKLFGGFVCVQRKSLTLDEKGKDNFITISRRLCTKEFQNSLLCFILER